jgi:hypothetical protein
VFRAIDAPLEAVVLRALSRDPADRFADAEAFIAALRAPGTLVRESVRDATGKRFLALALAVVAMVLVVSGWAAFSRGFGSSAWSSGRNSAARAVPNATPGTAAMPLMASATPATPVANGVAASELPVSPRGVEGRRRTPPVGSSVRSAARAESGSAANGPVRAHLDVVVVPYGDVWLDGVRLGPSPENVDVSPGRHTVSGGRTSAERHATFDLSPGESREVVFGDSHAGDQNATDRRPSVSSAPPGVAEISSDVAPPSDPRTK